jgi:ribosome maturation protein SDO1
MIPLDNAVTARLESHGLRFEILVDPELADKMRHGVEGIDIEDAVAALNVYENASHGEKSPDEDLLKVLSPQTSKRLQNRLSSKEKSI